MLLQAVGAASDPASGRPPDALALGLAGTAHRHRIVADRHAVPAGAWAARKPQRYLNRGSDEMTLVCTGEGATSEGEFWECMNIACLETCRCWSWSRITATRFPSRSSARRRAATFSRLLEGFPGLFRIEVDGTDFVASYRALQPGRRLLPQGHGPGAGARLVTRPYSHSLSDDERLYKTAAEREAEAARDPLLSLPEFLDCAGRARTATRSSASCTRFESEVARGQRSRAARSPALARISALLSVFG